MRARARQRLVAFVLAVVVVAGCSGGAAPVGSGGPDRSEQVPVAEAGAALPQGRRAPLELGGGFGRWREVFGGTFQYWRGQDLRYRFRERADRGRGGSHLTDRDSAFEDWLGGDWTDTEWTHSEWVDQEWVDQEWVDQYWPDFGSVAAEVRLDVHLAPTGSAGHVDWDCREPSGRERLELLDPDGQVVHRVAASVAQPAVRVHKSLGDVTYKFLYGWCAVVAHRPAFDSYRIVRDRIDGDGQQHTVVVLERAASPHGPGVSIASPVRGQRFDAVEVTVEWSAWDADADELTSQVFYTADGGATYRWVYAERHPPVDALTVAPVDRGPLMGPQTRAVFSGDSAGFESTGQARFLVVVSDGARWTVALSPAFAVA